MTSSFSSSDAKPYARTITAAGYATLSVIAFLLTVGIGTDTDWIGVHLALSLAGIVAPALEASKYGEGSRIARLLREPLIAGYATVIAMAGPAGVGFAYFRAVRAGLPADGLPLTAGTIISAIGIALMGSILLFRRRGCTSAPYGRYVAFGIISPLAAAAAMFMILSDPASADDLFEARFGMPLEGVRAAYAGYDLLSDRVFENTFGISKGAYLAEWLKLRDEHPGFLEIALPGGSPT